MQVGLNDCQKTVVIVVVSCIVHINQQDSMNKTPFHCREGDLSLAQSLDPSLNTDLNPDQSPGGSLGGRFTNDLRTKTYLATKSYDILMTNSQKNHKIILRRI